MKNDLIKLTIAVIFAVLAAALNFIWVKQQLPKYDEYVIYKTKLKDGEEILSEHLDHKRLPIPKSEYDKTLIPWENRSVLYGMKLSRSVDPDELALPSDAVPVTAPPEMTILGPFRILSIGDQLVSGQSARIDGRPKLPVTIVTKSPSKTETGKFEENVSRLMQILDMEKKSAKARGSDANLFYISSVVAYPKKAEEGDDPENASPLEEDQVALALDLPNVPVITDLLLDANMRTAEIGFVVPKRVVDSLKN